MAGEPSPARSSQSAGHFTGRAAPGPRPPAFLTLPFLHHVAEAERPGAAAGQSPQVEGDVRDDERQDQDQEAGHTRSYERGGALDLLVGGFRRPRGTAPAAPAAASAPGADGS